MKKYDVKEVEVFINEQKLEGVVEARAVMGFNPDNLRLERFLEVKYEEGADTRVIERAIRKIPGIIKHRKRVANRQKLYEKKHSEPFERRMAKICKSCSFRHNFMIDGEPPIDYKDCTILCEHTKGCELIWGRIQKGLL